MENVNKEGLTIHDIITCPFCGVLLNKRNIMKPIQPTKIKNIIQRRKGICSCCQTAMYDSW